MKYDNEILTPVTVLVTLFTSLTSQLALFVSLNGSDTS